MTHFPLTQDRKPEVPCIHKVVVSKVEGRITHKRAVTLHICPPYCQDPDRTAYTTGAGIITAHQGPRKALSSRMKRYEKLT